MAASKSKIRRCAIYTRKSSEEGLEQDFNSLDAQREACEAYIKSQAGEGWKLVRSRYDDGGYSGGTMERPGLQTLLSDIEAKRIDVIVVYKVDRLTRSLADFAKIVDVFDSQGVSFVSVTQQFNTTTSMGRLTLNMLLSFAQFEREVTGERIRDKIAASKQKGMWMGGFVPLGYEPNGRTLTINQAEAETVRTIFKLYLEHGSGRRVKVESDRLGLTTKARPGAKSRWVGGRPFSRGHIYRILSNPLYVGEIPHKDTSYPGLHDAIISTETWYAVQAQLAANTGERSSGERVSEPSPLKGKLFDEAGIRLTPSHAVKSGRRYRYYVSMRLIGDTATRTTEQSGWRLPAREIERIVCDAIEGLLADRAALVGAVRDSGIEADRVSDILNAVSQWQGQALDLVERVDLDPSQIAISINLSSLSDVPDKAIHHLVRTRLRRRGVEMRLVLEGNDSNPSKPDPALIKAVARASKWFDDLSNGRARSLGSIAEAENISDRYVSTLMPLAFLAPDIVEAVLAGTQPAELTAETLIRRTDLPLDWTEQKAVLGFG